jgi:hypothetical protein
VAARGRKYLAAVAVGAHLAAATVMFKMDLEGRKWNEE